VQWFHLVSFLWAFKLLVYGTPRRMQRKDIE